MTAISNPATIAPMNESTSILPLEKASVPATPKTKGSEGNGEGLFHDGKTYFWCRPGKPIPKDRAVILRWEGNYCGRCHGEVEHLAVAWSKDRKMFVVLGHAYDGEYRRLKAKFTGLDADAAIIAAEGEEKTRLKEIEAMPKCTCGLPSIVMETGQREHECFSCYQERVKGAGWLPKDSKQVREVFRTTELGDSSMEATPSKGWSTWIEEGKIQASLIVNPDHFGSHNYGDGSGTESCFHGCGCWMGSCRSGGHVDPFGPCPMNPHKGMTPKRPVGGPVPKLVPRKECDHAAMLVYGDKFRKEVESKGTIPCRRCGKDLPVKPSDAGIEPSNIRSEADALDYLRTKFPDLMKDPDLRDMSVVVLMEIGQDLLDIKGLSKVRLMGILAGINTLLYRFGKAAIASARDTSKPDHATDEAATVSKSMARRFVENYIKDRKAAEGVDL